jgi:chromosome segregation protein
VDDLNGNPRTPEFQRITAFLRDLVKVPEEYKPVVDVLLGNAPLWKTWIRRVSAWTSNGKNQCLVTLEGDMVDPKRDYHRRKAGPELHGIFARKREIQTLVQAVSGHGKRAEEIFKANWRRRFAEKEEREEPAGDLEGRKAGLSRTNSMTWIGRTFQLSHELDQMERLSRGSPVSSASGTKRRASTGRPEEARIGTCSGCKEKRELGGGFFPGKGKGTPGERRGIRDLPKRAGEAEDGSQPGQGRTARLDPGGGKDRRFCPRRPRRPSGESRKTSCRPGKARKIASKRGELPGRDEGVYALLGKGGRGLNRADQDRNVFRNEIREEEKKAEAVRNDWRRQGEDPHGADGAVGDRFQDGWPGRDGERRYGLNLHDIYRNHLGEDYSLAEVREKLEHVKKLRERLGEVNLTAIQEHEALKERYTFITTQRQDLLDSILRSRKPFARSTKPPWRRFMETFQLVDEKLKVVFPILFSGGTAGLKLVDESNRSRAACLLKSSLRERR